MMNDHYVRFAWAALIAIMCPFAAPRAGDSLTVQVLLTVPGRNDLKPFFELFYQAEGLKSGMHHPDGILWIDRPGLAPKVHRDKVPLRSVAPTILGFYCVEPPATFSGKPIEL